MAAIQIQLSPGSVLAWQLAIVEAAKARQPCFEPAHLFIGVCKVVTPPEGGWVLKPAAPVAPPVPGVPVAPMNPGVPAAPAKPRVPAEQAVALQIEAQALMSLFASFCLDWVTLYRDVRKRLPAGPPIKALPGKAGVPPSASVASHAVLQRAKLAAGPLPVNALHLLGALLEDTRGIVAKLVREQEVDLNALRQAAIGEALLRTTQPGPKPEPSVEIAQTFDAKASSFDPAPLATPDSARQLALLYELPLTLAAATKLDELLQKIVEQLIEVIPGAKRGVLLLHEPTTRQLVLRAYLPADQPAVSLTLAQVALKNKEGFIWQQSEMAVAPVSALTHCIRTGMYAPLVWRGEVLGVICVDNPEHEGAFSKDDLRLLVAVGHYAALAVVHQRALDELRRQSELASRVFGSRFAPHVRETLVRAAVSGALPIGTRQSQVTVLVSDIRGFAELCARIGAQRTRDLLNEYFPPLVTAIHAHKGTVERFVGDAIFAVFGSPEPDSEQHEHAVRAALAMQAISAAVMKSRAMNRAETCQIGIGIACGEAMHGFVGNAERLEFVVVGDPPNLASRYCNAAGKGEILVSPEIHARLFNKFKFERIEVQLKHEGVLPAFRVRG